MTKTSREILEQNNPKLKQVHIAFSNGGYVIREAIQQLPQEYRDTIIVITVSSTAIVEDSVGCHQAYNVIGGKDVASQACNGWDRGINALREKTTIIEVSQTETESLVGGHYFMQPEYQNQIKSILKNDVFFNYEIY